MAIVACSLSPLMLGSCSASGIVFANYESYMSPDLIDKNRTVDGQQVRYVSYSTNEDIQAKFKRSYDLAVPSTYTVLELIRTQEVAELDWSMFSTEGHPLNSNAFRWDTPSTSYLIEYARPYNSYPGTTTDDKMEAARNDPHNALTLFSDTVINIIFSVDDYAHTEGYYGVDKTLLNYSLPYFDQDLMFAYHGDYIGNETTNDGGGYKLTAPELDSDESSPNYGL
jgi:spermidine/putrescine-binding protein